MMMMIVVVIIGGVWWGRGRGEGGDSKRGGAVGGMRFTFVSGAHSDHAGRMMPDSAKGWARAQRAWAEKGRDASATRGNILTIF